MEDLKNKNCVWVWKCESYMRISDDVWVSTNTGYIRVKVVGFINPQKFELIRGFLRRKGYRFSQMSKRWNKFARKLDEEFEELISFLYDKNIPFVDHTPIPDTLKDFV